MLNNQQVSLLEEIEALHNQQITIIKGNIKEVLDRWKRLQEQSES